MSEFTSIDLSQLPAPQVVEALSYDTILEELKAALAVEMGTREWDMPSEPIVKLLEISAYRELILRQRYNEAAKQVMLAYATDGDLDNLAAFYKVERQEGEGNDRLRVRTQLALEGFSTAGPEGAYIFHTLAASPSVKSASIEVPTFDYAELDPELEVQLPGNVIVLQVLDDAGLQRPMPGDVVVNLLAQEGNGVAPVELTEAVSEHLRQEQVRPITDNPVARSSEIVEYQIDADLYFYSGPDSEVVLQDALTAVQDYTQQQHQNGESIELSAVYACLHRSGVRRVDLRSPAATIVCTKRQAPYCTSVNVVSGNVNE